MQQTQSQIQTIYQNPDQLTDIPKPLHISISIGERQNCQNVVLKPEDKRIYSIGSASGNDVQINSRLVSGKHGVVCFFHNKWHYADLGSTNGTMLDQHYIHAPEKRGQAPVWYALSVPGVLRIDHFPQSHSEQVSLVVSHEESIQSEKVPLTKEKVYTIGRSSDNAICIPHVTVSRNHAIIRWKNGAYYISDHRSTNGVTVNSSRIAGAVLLKNRDVIRIGRVMIVFMGDHLEVFRPNAAGVSVVAHNVCKYVYENDHFSKKKKILLNNVSLEIRPGELVAIIGGSGAGKTTLMNALSKFTEKQQGSVLIDGQDLDRDYASIKDMIGYVPQQDIVYEQLPLEKMLEYAARMRMPADTSNSERQKRISEVLEIVQLTEHRHTLIRKLSGGQKKRASIAVELLADPSLFFLDEPTSGLDAGTEEKLMQSLRQLAKNGKTVILVTHSTLNLHLCDRIIAMGRGGRLCFSGTLEEAMQFFQVERIAEIYHKLDNESKQWSSRFNTRITQPAAADVKKTSKAKNGIGLWTQFQILTSRYMQIMLKNGKQLAGIAGQAVIFAFVLVLVSKENLYVEFKGTQTVNFVTACLGMWMGLFLAIQEITKERGILRREYLANLKLMPYLLSKVTVLGLLSACQTVILQVSSFLFSVILDKNLPDTSILMPCYIENGITIFMVSFASICMGLMISALVRQPERIAPYVLMPQIVLSGVLFDLGGAFEYVKWLVFTYWGNRALCASSDANQLGVNQLGAMFEEVEDYAFEANNLLTCWGVLLLLAVVMILIAYVSLRSLRKDDR